MNSWLSCWANPAHRWGAQRARSLFSPTGFSGAVAAAAAAALGPEGPEGPSTAPFITEAKPSASSPFRGEDLQRSDL
mgnify:CR=1 FL=1